MASGPSKEELEMYWKSSRQYFDELANYYKTADPSYYEKFIAPFYNNPFINSASSKRGGSSWAILVMAVIVFFLIGFAAVGVLYFTSAESEPEINYEPPKIEKKVGREIDKPKIDSVKIEEPVIPKKDNNRKKRIERIR